MDNRGSKRKTFLGLALFAILLISILTVIPNSSALVNDSQDRIENQIDQMEKYRSSIANTDDEISELSNSSTVAENAQNSQAFSSPRVKAENDQSSNATTLKMQSSIDGLDADEEHTEVIAQQSGRSFTITSDVVQPGAGGLVAYEQHILLSGSLTTDGNLIVGTGSLQYVCQKIFYNVDGSIDTTNPRYTDISGTVPNIVLMSPDGAGMLLVNAADFNLGLPDGCGFFQNVPYTLGPNGGIFASGSNPSTFHTYEISVPNSQPSTNLHVVTPIGQIKPGDMVVLDVGYSDPDGDRLFGYEIVQTGGPTVNLEPGTPSFGQYQFTVPQVTEDTTFSFESTVSDGLMSYPSLTSAPSSLNILVSPDNHPPEAVAIASSNPVDAGEIVTLDGTQSHDPDPGDSIVSYQWQQIDPPGDIIGSSPTVQFTAPEVDTETTFRFGLTVRDSHDAFGLTTVDVLVKPPQCPEVASDSVTAQQLFCPNPPVAVAESVPDKRVLVDGQIDLDGRKSHDPDPGDSVVGFEWTKTQPSDNIAPNTLSDPASSTPTFDVPNYIPAEFTSPTTPPRLLPLKFSLQVTDNHGLKSTNDATVSLDVVCSTGDQAKAEKARTFFLGLINLPGGSLKSPETVDNFKYFLSGRGDTQGLTQGITGKGIPQPLPIQWLDNEQEFKTAQRVMGSDMKKDLNQILKPMQPGQTQQLVKTYTYDVTDKRKIYHLGKIPSDFTTAVGSAKIFADVDLKVTKGNRILGSDEVSGTVKLRLQDNYDFNPGKTFSAGPLPLPLTSVTSDEIYQLIKCLGARNFNQDTTYSKVITKASPRILDEYLVRCIDFPNVCRIPP